MKYLKLINSDEQIPAGKLVCVGKNYAKHAAEMGSNVPEFPIIFLKPYSSLIFNGDNVEYPENSGDLHYEVELVLLIGRTIKNATKKEAEDAIAGYAIGLDMTLRTIQNELKDKGHPWTLAKVFDTSAVLSDIKVKKDYKLRGDERITLSVNGEVRQNSSLDNMVFNSVELVEFISSKFTLEKGDLIYTGTPEGVGAVYKGDKLYGEIENIGKLETTIV